MKAAVDDLCALRMMLAVAEAAGEGEK